jgi:hypothetical protein
MEPFRFPFHHLPDDMQKAFSFLAFMECVDNNTDNIKLQNSVMQRFEECDRRQLIMVAGASGP